MYSPTFYRESREDLIHKLIDESPFALLLSSADGAITHLPLLRKGRELVGHMARANPQWRGLARQPQCRAVFQGPHAYVSPAWYQPKPDNVPTWNYAAVHVIAQFEMIEDPRTAFAAMAEMVKHFEAHYRTGWTLPHGESAIEDLLRGIVVFRLRELAYDAKFKMSQKLDRVDRDRVIKELGDRAGEMAGVARWMRDLTLPETPTDD